jgi:hypothetical protein
VEPVKTAVLSVQASPGRWPPPDASTSRRGWRPAVDRAVAVRAPRLPAPRWCPPAGTGCRRRGDRPQGRRRRAAGCRGLPGPPRRGASPGGAGVAGRATTAASSAPQPRWRRGGPRAAGRGIRRSWSGAMGTGGSGGPPWDGAAPRRGRAPRDGGRTGRCARGIPLASGPRRVGAPPWPRRSRRTGGAPPRGGGRRVGRGRPRGPEAGVTPGIASGGPAEGPRSDASGGAREHSPQPVGTRPTVVLRNNSILTPLDEIAPSCDNKGGHDACHRGTL